MSHLDAVQLDELAKELEASAEGLVEQVHNTPLRSRRRGVSSNEASDSSSEEGEDGEEEGEDGEIEDENEEEQNLLLARLEKVREALQESLRRGKEEKVAKMARLQQHRLELEHLTKSLHTPQPAPPVYANDRSSPHLVGAVCFGLAMMMVLWVVMNHLFIYYDRSLALYYMHPT